MECSIRYYFIRSNAYSRLIEEKMLSLLRQGKISKWFSWNWAEAISASASVGMHSDEFILPMHRNLEFL